MKVALLVIGDGRGEYLEHTVPAVLKNVLHPITARLMIDDSGDDDYARTLDDSYPEFRIVHGGRRGLAGAVQAGFDLCLDHDPDYVLWIEEDMLITRMLPVTQAVMVLEAHPELAQMCFKREPFDPAEGTDQLAAQCKLAAFFGEKASYTWHDSLFSLNPCLIPRRVLELGWPSGPLGVGNEAGMTPILLDQGYVFGSWGHVGDEPYARHLGVRRSAQWQL